MSITLLGESGCAPSDFIDRYSCLQNYKKLIGKLGSLASDMGYVKVEENNIWYPKVFQSDTFVDGKPEMFGSKLIYHTQLFKDPEAEFRMYRSKNVGADPSLMLRLTLEPYKISYSIFDKTVADVFKWNKSPEEISTDFNFVRGRYINKVWGELVNFCKEKMEILNRIPL